MNLWLQWYKIVRPLQGSCSRWSTYVCLVLVLLGFTLRGEAEGVTSLMRGLGLRSPLYKRLLHFFNTSRGLSLSWLTRLWVERVLQWFPPLTVNGHWVLVGDGIKIPKEGRKMPGVKSLHQESSNNSKPEYIMGHSLQALALLVLGPGGEVAAVSLLSRLHEGLRRSPRDRKTLLNRLVEMLLSVSLLLPQPVYLVGDSYYASGDLMAELQQEGHHLITRARKNAVAYHPAPTPPTRRRGRPRKYGAKVRLQDLFARAADFVKAKSPLRGGERIGIEYRSEVLLWKPLGKPVLFVWVKHPVKGNLILMCTDVTLKPEEVIRLYGYRFRIEVGFREAVQTLGTYAYRFWMKAMPPRRRGEGDQYLHRKPPAYREQVERKVEAYHRFVQCGTIAHGLMQYLALFHGAEVWDQFRSWFRTQNRHSAPSVRVVANALRCALAEFLRVAPPDQELRKILEENRDKQQVPDFQWAA